MFSMIHKAMVGQVGLLSRGVNNLMQFCRQQDDTDLISENPKEAKYLVQVHLVASKCKAKA